MDEFNMYHVDLMNQSPDFPYHNPNIHWARGRNMSKMATIPSQVADLGGDLESFTPVHVFCMHCIGRALGFCEVPRDNF